MKTGNPGESGESHEHRREKAPPRGLTMVAASLLGAHFPLQSKMGCCLTGRRQHKGLAETMAAWKADTLSMGWDSLGSAQGIGPGGRTKGHNPEPE